MATKAQRIEEKKRTIRVFDRGYVLDDTAAATKALDLAGRVKTHLEFELRLLTAGLSYVRGV